MSGAPRKTTLSKDDILQVFAAISEAIFIAGGSVSVLHSSRTATEDIDFFCEHTDTMNDLEDMAKSVGESMNLAQNFMNSAVRFFVRHENFKEAIPNSVRQNEVLFRGEGIVVYSADYGYQYLAKLHRLSRPNSRATGVQVEKDRRDAAFYLRQLCLSKGRRLTRQEIKDLYPNKTGEIPIVSDAEMDAVDEIYREVYGEDDKPFAI
ncbi:hypothetical protein CPC08DRAFT_712981 [Agrocybe pediades]|nr:hypothetical protein CPC08DRAFT_712981 [Agrocybe pediades]